MQDKFTWMLTDQNRNCPYPIFIEAILKRANPFAESINSMSSKSTWLAEIRKLIVNDINRPALLFRFCFFEPESWKFLPAERNSNVEGLHFRTCYFTCIFVFESSFYAKTSCTCYHGRDFGNVLSNVKWKTSSYCRQFDFLYWTT